MDGNKPFTVIIPARFGSSRLPGKPLIDINGKPMIQHVYERALASRAHRVIIATDNQSISVVAKAFGAEVCMTKESHPSGTDRLQEVALLYGMEEDEVLVNVQGDEPLIPPSVITQVADMVYATLDVSAATLCTKITTREELFNPHVVKVISNKYGCALYFSRAPVPWIRDEFIGHHGCTSLPETVDSFRRHIGIYAYRVGVLNRFVSWGVSPIEQLESLEQLRLLWHGEKIQVADAVEIPPCGVDTIEDLKHISGLVTKP